MSHYVVMVIGDNPEAQLAPYSENLEVDEYVYGEVTNKDKRGMLEYYRLINKIDDTTTFDECYKLHGEDWNGGTYRKGDDGVWRKYSTYNPNSKWDWYMLGGRWSGWHIKLKPGAKSGIIGEKSWTREDAPGVDAALKGDIDFDAISKEEFAPYALIKDGKWYARGEMGWWGASIEMRNKEEWVNEVWELVKLLPDNTLISFYDCHI